MNEKDRSRDQGGASDRSGQQSGHGGAKEPGHAGPERSKGKEEDVSRKPSQDAEQQREGNLGNERNRNKPDNQRSRSGSRGKKNR